jgi:hypothetical protein
LLNQVRLLEKAGAVSLQVSMMTPSNGSRGYGEMFASGLVFESVAGRPVELHMVDGNHVIASGHEQPWKKQLSILAAYLYFYNPLRFLAVLTRPTNRMCFAKASMQLIGMRGLMQTIRHTLFWTLRLMRGNIERKTEVPTARIPMCGANGSAASHALRGTPKGQYSQLKMEAQVDSCTPWEAPGRGTIVHREREIPTA